MTQKWDPRATEHVWPGQQPPAPPPPQRSMAVRLLIRLGVVVGGIVLLVSIANAGKSANTSSSNSTTNRAATPPAASTSTSPATLASTGPVSTFSDGFYEVGRDIIPGTFAAPGGRNCFWERSRDATGQSRITNEWSPGQGQVIVTTKAGEYLKVSDCGTWTKR